MNAEPPATDAMDNQESAAAPPPRVPATEVPGNEEAATDTSLQPLATHPLQPPATAVSHHPSATAELLGPTQFATVQTGEPTASVLLQVVALPATDAMDNQESATAPTLQVPATDVMAAKRAVVTGNEEAATDPPLRPLATQPQESATAPPLQVPATHVTGNEEAADPPLQTPATQPQQPLGTQTGPSASGVPPPHSTVSQQKPAAAAFTTVLDAFTQAMQNPQFRMKVAPRPPTTPPHTQPVVPPVQPQVGPNTSQSQPTATARQADSPGSTATGKKKKNQKHRRSKRHGTSTTVSTPVTTPISKPPAQVSIVAAPTVTSSVVVTPTTQAPLVSTSTVSTTPSSLVPQRTKLTPAQKARKKVVDRMNLEALAMEPSSSPTSPASSPSSDQPSSLKRKAQATSKPSKRRETDSTATVSVPATSTVSTTPGSLVPQPVRSYTSSRFTYDADGKVINEDSEDEDEEMASLRPRNIQPKGSKAPPTDISSSSKSDTTPVTREVKGNDDDSDIDFGEDSSEEEEEEVEGDEEKAKTDEEEEEEEE
jgi:hypothetical protein